MKFSKAFCLSSAALFASSTSAFAFHESPAFKNSLKLHGGGVGTTTAIKADPVPDLKAPPALYQGAVAAGAAKASAPFGKIFKLGMVSGKFLDYYSICNVCEILLVKLLAFSFDCLKCSFSICFCV